MTHPDMMPIDPTIHLAMKETHPNDERDIAVDKAFWEYCRDSPNMDELHKHENLVRKMQELTAHAFLVLMDHCDETQWQGYITSAFAVETFWFANDWHAGVWTLSKTSKKPCWKTLSDYIAFIDAASNRKQRTLDRKRGKPHVAPRSPYEALEDS